MSRILYSNLTRQTHKTTQRTASPPVADQIKESRLFLMIFFLCSCFFCYLCLSSFGVKVKLAAKDCFVKTKPNQTNRTEQCIQIERDKLDNSV